MHHKIPKNYGPTDIRVLVDLADIRHREFNMRDVVRSYLSSLPTLIPNQVYLIKIFFLQCQICWILLDDSRAFSDRSRLLVPAPQEDSIECNVVDPSSNKDRRVDCRYCRHVSEHILCTLGNTLESRPTRLGHDERVSSEFGRRTRQYYERATFGSDTRLTDHSPTYIRQSLLAT